MKIKKPTRAARVALYFLLALGLAYWFFLWSYKRPFFDPDPKGEGSFKEVDSITKQFKDFYSTKDVSLLPKGHVRLEEIGKEELDGTWIIYYATASHSKVRGGTIMLLDNTGRIDTYFGHHCSSGDGGYLIVPGLDLYGGFYEGGTESVRAAFSKSFKHQHTEQIMDANIPSAPQPPANGTH